MLEWLEKISRYLKLESDLRVDRWFLMSSSVPTVLICFSFLVIAKLLHVYMKPREALNIRWAIWSFDVFHMTVSLIFLTFCFILVENFNFRWVFHMWIYMARQIFLFSCQPVDKSPDGVKTASLAWWYFIYNFTFFTEIFIFLVGKKHERITKYFVFHHIALPISIWWIVKVLPSFLQLERKNVFWHSTFQFSTNGHSLFFGFVNCSVHVMSFGYLSLIGAFPKAKKHFRFWRIFFPFLLVRFNLYCTMKWLPFFFSLSDSSNFRHRSSRHSTFFLEWLQLSHGVSFHSCF